MTIVDACQVCGKTSSLMNCKRCKSVAYCSADCQRRDWKTHKPTCQRKEFAGAPCDCCSNTENVTNGDMCLKCGNLYCKTCDEEHLTRDLLDGSVASFAPCPSCRQRRDFIRQGDCKKLEKLVQERPSDPRLANWLVTLGSRVQSFDITRRGEEKSTFYVPENSATVKVLAALQKFTLNIETGTKRGSSTGKQLLSFMLLQWQSRH
jgi:MYND finger